MIKKTKNYDIFHFREDNRVKIDPAHVRKLKQSIAARNLLNLRPIIVNADMEIIDGQHRLLAARELNTDIYYEVKEEIETNDIVLLNISKSWSNADFLNYYARNGYKDYQDLQKFIKEKNITLSLAFSLLGMKTNDEKVGFKHGKFKFTTKIDVYFDLCWQTVDIIKSYITTSQGKNYFTKTSRFWKALCVLFAADDFDEKIWINNLKKSIDMFGPRVNVKGYLRLFEKVYNHRVINKIKIVDIEEDEE